ncbi:hypothetical protein Lser_V15G39961 [Lactuca serriola]|uniref:Uncharacterized protein n=1 Tax=Lactuca sativa TaxID=4236 RepID=A0A9R1UT00_LACSA|nr:hypothetical protein LSAT_V11C800437470 [Lactuca sativa]
MSFPYEQPPSTSSVALRIFNPDLPVQGQPMVAGEYATEAPAPTYSTGLFKSSQQQFPADGQRALPAYESVIPPPQETAVRTLEHSTNQLNTGDGNREWDDTYGGGRISGFVRQNYSSNVAVDDYYSNGEAAPGISGYAQRDHSNTGSSTVDTESDEPPNAGYSMTGNKFKNAYKLFNQFD